MEPSARPSAATVAQDLSDLQRLIKYLQERRAQLLEATGGAFDRRIADATILLGKLWVAAMNMRLTTLQPVPVTVPIRRAQY
jgi:hypothetical protein